MGDLSVSYVNYNLWHCKSSQQSVEKYVYLVTSGVDSTDSMCAKTGLSHPLSPQHAGYNSHP